jgi:hypothetical protein
MRLLKAIAIAVLFIVGYISAVLLLIAVKRDFGNVAFYFFLLAILIIAIVYVVYKNETFGSLVKKLKSIFSKIT